MLDQGIADARIAPSTRGVNIDSAAASALLDALALYEEGRSRIAERIMWNLRDSGEIQELVEALCPTLSDIPECRRQRIERLAMPRRRHSDGRIKFGSASASLEEMVQSKHDSGMSEKLTTKQRVVLIHVARGCSNRAIAQRLAVSENTIKWHLKEAFRRLGASNRTDAIRLAMLQGSRARSDEPKAPSRI
jgi:DNA-binding NarL/FixJ family response regulator